MEHRGTIEQFHTKYKCAAAFVDVCMLCVDWPRLRALKNRVLKRTELSSEMFWVLKNTGAGPRGAQSHPAICWWPAATSEVLTCAEVASGGAPQLAYWHARVWNLHSSCLPHINICLCFNYINLHIFVSIIVTSSKFFRSHPWPFSINAIQIIPSHLY